MPCEHDTLGGNTGCGALLAEDDDLSERKRIGMRDRELRRASADLREAPGGAAMQPKLRRTAGLSDHFDVAPQHALSVPGPERLHCGFLGREASREMNRGITAPHAVRHFALSENAVREALAISLYRGGNSWNICRVES